MNIIKVALSHFCCRTTVQSDSVLINTTLIPLQLSKTHQLTAFVLLSDNDVRRRVGVLSWLSLIELIMLCSLWSPSSGINKRLHGSQNRRSEQRSLRSCLSLKMQWQHITNINNMKLIIIYTYFAIEIENIQEISCLEKEARCCCWHAASCCWCFNTDRFWDFRWSAHWKNWHSLRLRHAEHA